MSSLIPAWKRPARPSFPLVLLGKVYVAAADPDSDGYVLRAVEQGTEQDGGAE